MEIDKEICDENEQCLSLSLVCNNTYEDHMFLFQSGFI